MEEILKLVYNACDPTNQPAHSITKTAVRRVVRAN